MTPVSKCKNHQQRSDSIQTQDFIEKLQIISDDSSQKSMRSIAKDVGISEATIQRTVHENLRYKPYVMKRTPFMCFVLFLVKKNYDQD